MNKQVQDIEKKEKLYKQHLYVSKMNFEILMDGVMSDLHKRKKSHASSKHTGMEKIIFSEYNDTFPNIWGINKKGPHPYPNDYEDALRYHATKNDYVPNNHAVSGILDMNLMQLIEMTCDIVTSAQEQGWDINRLSAYLKSTDFANHLMIEKSYSEDLIRVIINTASELMGKTANG